MQLRQLQFYPRMANWYFIRILPLSQVEVESKKSSESQHSERSSSREQEEEEERQQQAEVHKHRVQHAQSKPTEPSHIGGAGEYGAIKQDLHSVPAEQGARFWVYQQNQVLSVPWKGPSSECISTATTFRSDALLKLLSHLSYSYACQNKNIVLIMVLMFSKHFGWVLYVLFYRVAKCECHDRFKIA